MDEYKRQMQKKLLGSFGAIILIFFLKTRVFPWVYGLWMSRNRQAALLGRLAARSHEVKAQKEQLEKELREEEEKLAIKQKKGEEKRTRISGAAGDWPKFQFTKAAGTESATLPVSIQAPATRPTPVNSARLPAAPTTASNPWGSLSPAAIPALARAPAPALAPAPIAPVPASSFTAERIAQDEEYNESLRADMARIEAREEAERKEDEAIAIQASLRDLVPSDPGESGENEIIRITFKLVGFGRKDSVRFTRRFRRTETTTDVMNFWRAHALVEPEDVEAVEICTQYPGHPLEPDLELSRFSAKEAFVVRLKSD